MASSAGTEIDMNELKTQLQSGVSFNELAATRSRPPKWRDDAFRRAAFVGSFDEARFRNLIVPGSTEADFQACIAMPGIERARLLPEQTYRLKDEVAAEHLKTWLTRQGSEAIRRFSRKVLGKLPPNTAEIERLRFLIPVDPEKALELFDRLFDEADRDFDLARCHTLVELLRDLDNFDAGDVEVPLRLLSPVLRERCNTLARYVAARSRFVEDYSKSAHFLDREELTGPTRAFLDHPDQWLLTIYGRGGIGKSMFLRWLVAREAIPRPKCIPVATLDFDDIDISKLAEFPGLIFIRFAEQLNRQIPRTPFGEYLGDYGRFEVLLLPPARLPGGLNVSSLESELRNDPQLNAFLEERFADKLSKPAVVLLDTLEKGVLHFPGALRKTLTCLRSAHERNSHLKVVLSGRYDLKERGYLEKGDPEPVALKPLKEEDARRLLCDVIGLKPSEVIDAIVRKSEGNPFILSLIAQLVQSGKVKTETEVDALKPEFAYLIERIIDQIPDSQRAVRWVVRYGVVPRSLTREFLQTVMRPHLEPERSSAAKDGHRDRLQQFAESFPRASEFDLEAVWQDLQLYADTCGWLRADAESLRFQPEVVRPMRALLRGEPVFGELHASAAAWFSACAEEAEKADDGDTCVRATAEALYHCFEAGDPLAEGRWEKALNAKWAQPIDRRRILLEAVTDLLDFGALAENGDISLPVEPALAAYALRELAKVEAGVGFGTVPPPKDTSQVAELLRLAEKISPDPGSPGERLVRIALAAASHEYETALSLGLKLESEKALTSPAESYTMHVLLARSFATTQSVQASDHYRRACSLLFPEDAALGVTIWRECARMLRDVGDWEGAMAAYTEASHATRDGGDLFVVNTDIAELMMEGGAYDAALARIGLSERESLRSREAFRRSRIRALCEISHGRPDRAEPIVRSMASAPDGPLQVAQFLELQGELAAAQYNAREAASLFERACQSYSEAGFETEANEAQLKWLRVVKDQIGDWHLVRDLLNSFNDKARSFGRLVPLVAVEAAHFSFLTGERELPFLDHQFAAIAREAEPEKHFDRHMSLLEGVQPVGMRYPLLKIFAALPTGRGPPEVTRDTTQILVSIVLPGGAADPDYFPKAFGVIDLLGFMSKNEGRARLQEALDLEQPSLLPQLLDAAARLEADLPPLETLRECLAQAATHGFGFAAAVKYVRLAFDRSKPDVAEEALQMLPQVPEELRGTQIEAMEKLYFARFRDLNEREKRKARHRAAEILRQLGQDQTLAQILRPPSGLPWSRRPRATVELNEVSPNWPLSSRRKLIPYELAKQLAGSAGESIADLKRALAEWELTPKVGVELRIDDAPAAAMLPWEWALGDHDVCYRSSARLPAPRSSISRLIGAKLHHRVRQLFSFRRSLRLIILRPPISSQESTGRGFELQSRRPLREIYAAQGVRAIEPKGTRAGRRQVGDGRVRSRRRAHPGRGGGTQPERSARFTGQNGRAWPRISGGAAQGRLQSDRHPRPS